MASGEWRVASKTRAVYFDAVGTLIHPEPAVAVIYAEAARRFGSRYEADEILKRFRVAFAAQEVIDSAARWVTDESRELRRWREIVGDVLDDVADPADCFEFLYGHFAKPQAWRCDDEAATLFESLSARGYRLGLASNYDHRLHVLMRGIEALQRLTHVAISSEVGFRKPAAEFFRYMCRQMGLDAAQIMYVGDDPINDYAGA
ncbi:MAG: HAD-IA family hydrolase, partial [Stellaceae bacterium]